MDLHTKNVINTGAGDAALVEDEQVENPVQANPIQADIGNIEEDNDLNSGDDGDANDNQMGMKRNFGS